MVLGISSKQDLMPLDYSKSFLRHEGQVNTSGAPAVRLWRCWSLTQCVSTSEGEVSGPETLQPGHQRAEGLLGSCCWLGTNKCPQLSRVGHGKLVGRKKLKQNREQHRDLKNLKVMASKMNISVLVGVQHWSLDFTCYPLSQAFRYCILTKSHRLCYLVFNLNTFCQSYRY